MASKSTLTWSKLVSGPKLQNGQYLGGLIIFYFVRGLKMKLADT